MKHQRMKRWNMFIKKANWKAGFTLMELLVVIAILAVLSGAAYVAINRSQGQLVTNKVASDLVAIQSALEQYKQDNSAFPVLADVSSTKNVSCFQEDTSYAHCDSLDTYFFQTKVDNDLLTKRYLQEVPLDPHANTHYAYGATADGRYYQLAATKEVSEGVYQAMVVGNLKESAGVLGLSSLIRSYDGPDFVMNGEANLPYSSDSRTVSARLYNVDGSAALLDGVAAADGALVSTGQRVAVGAGELVQLYFSDGSVSYLGDDALASELLLAPSSSVERSEAGLITRIRLKLTGGKIWNKVVRLSSAAEFNIETTSAIAGVRGTEFGLSEDPDTPGSLELVVRSGTVVARLKTPEELDAGVAGANVDDVIEFGKDDFTATENATGDGSGFTPYTVPASGGVMTPDTLLPLDQFNDYYQTPFSNNVRPRVLSFNGTLDPAELVFHPFNENLVLEALVAPDTPLLNWNDNVDFGVDEVVVTPNAVALDPDTPLRFRFVGPNGEYSLPSHPAVTLSDSTVLTEDQLLGNFVPGIDNGDSGELMPFEADITGLPASLVLSSGPINLTSPTPCDWSVAPANSGFLASNYGINNVFRPFDPSLLAAELGNNIGTRFDGNNSETVTVRCEVAPDNFDEQSVEIAYAPRSTSATYEYSFAAGSNISWNEATGADDPAEAVCDNLNEGGFDDWTLPSQLVYAGLDIPTEKMNLCQFNVGTNVCNDFEGDVVDLFLFQEEQNAASGSVLIMPSPGPLFFTGFIKDDTENSVAYRCVRN